MANAYAAAVSKRRSLLDQLEKLQAEIECYDKFIQMLVELDPTSSDSPKKKLRPVLQTEFDDITCSLLRQYGKPMTADEIVDAFRDTGRPLGGKDEVHNAYTKVWRSKKLTYIRGQGCWFADEPLSGKQKAPQPTFETMLNG